MSIRKRYTGRVRLVEQKYDVFVTGIGIAKFGEYPAEDTFLEVCKSTVEEALKNSKLKVQDVQAVVFGQAFAGLYGMHAVGRFFVSSIFPRHPEVWETDGSELAGMSAFRLAVNFIKSGLYDNVVVFCANKIQISDPESVKELIFAQQMKTASAQLSEYMKKTKCKNEHIVEVVRKNISNASSNPNAYIKKFSNELAERVIKNGAPLTSGACALVLMKNPPKNVDAVKVEATYQVTAVNSKPTRPEALRQIRKYLEEEGIKVDEISFFELFDVFPHQEIIWYEGLGLCDWGEGYKLVERKETHPKGKYPVNLSGGALSSNAVPVSSLARVAELAKILVEKKKERKRKEKILGLAHAVSLKDVATHTVAVLSF